MRKVDWAGIGGVGLSGVEPRAAKLMESYGTSAASWACSEFISAKLVGDARAVGGVPGVPGLGAEGAEGAAEAKGAEAAAEAEGAEGAAEAEGRAAEAEGGAAEAGGADVAEATSYGGGGAEEEELGAVVGL